MEHKRIAEEYNKESFRRKNKYDKELSLKVWLQNEALDALPENLKEHANTLDDSPMPLNRPYPMWHTPPIKGFKVSDFVKSSNTAES